MGAHVAMNKTAWPDRRGRGASAIAVIGIGCRFPGAAGPDEYWKLILEGGCGISEIPKDRWLASAYFDPDPDAIGMSRSKWGGFMENASDFDPAFFDISPAEAGAIDPQQRIVLEVACETAEDAGLSLQRLRDVRTGVFVGISMHDFATIAGQSRVTNDIWAGTGKANSMAANRISHRLDLTGPSLAIDTACSSALVAIAEACQNLVAGTCDMALAGGVNCMFEPSAFALFSRANMLSPTGSIYAFDARADGFVRGEGCGLVLLKRADNAIADGDRIYAVIAGTAVNQDGRTSTLTAPSPHAQFAMLQDLIEQSGINPAAIGFVEAHGTGTPVGDPIEARAIGRAIGRAHSAPLLVGSVKPNIGHLESAAGAAGFIKATLAIHHGIVPPNRNFQTPSPYIAFDALNIRVPIEPTVFPDTGAGARVAVVNSFGFGGTNASVCLHQVAERISPTHAVLANHQPISLAEPANEPILVPVSAPTKAHLARWAGQLADAIEGGLAIHSVRDVALALSRQHDDFAERAVVISSGDRKNLAADLRRLTGNPPPGDPDPKRGDVIAARCRSKRSVVFTFSGQGSQWRGMARQSLTEDRSFRAAVERFDSILRPYTGWSVIEEMMRPKVEFDRNDITQASIFAVEYGLAAMWRDRGVVPSLVLGHSLGEIAAAVVADAISLETAAKILSCRGTIRDKSPVEGAMAAVGLPAAEIIPLLPADETVLIAAFNGPTSHTLTGPKESLDLVLESLQARFPHASVRRLNVDFAWHSILLDYGKSWFHAEVGEVAWKNPAIPFVSTVTGKLHTVFDLEYWWQNLRQPVAYQKAIETCLDLGFEAFLELGPQRALTPLTYGITQHRSADAVLTYTLERDGDDRRSIARATANLHVNGVETDLNRILSGDGTLRINLPKREWIHQKIFPASLEAEHKGFEPIAHPLLGRRDIGPIPTWSNDFSLKGFSYIGGHRIQSDCLFPAAGYVEMMAAAVVAEQGTHGSIELRDITLHEALSLGEDDYFIFRTQYDPRLARVSIHALKRGEKEEWRLCASGYGWRRDFEIDNQNFDRSIMESELTLDENTLYDFCSLFGLEYSGAFRTIEHMWFAKEDRCVAKTRIPKGNVSIDDRYIIWPPLFDALLHSAVPIKAGLLKRVASGKTMQEAISSYTDCKLVLPIGIKRVLISANAWREGFIEFRQKSDGEDGESVDTFKAFDVEGRPILLIENVTDSRPIEIREGKTHQTKPSSYREYFEVMEERLVSDVAATPGARWLAFVDSPTTLASTITALEGLGVMVEVVQAAEIEVSRDELLKAISERSRGERKLAGIIFGLELTSSGDTEDLTTSELYKRAEGNVFRVVALGQALDTLRAEEDRPQIVMVTRQTRSVPGDGPMPASGLYASGAVGLLRTIGNECPEYNVRHIDADDAAIAGGEILARACLATAPERELILRGSTIWAPRLERIRSNELAAATRVVRSEDTELNYTVTMSRPGVLENLVFRELPKPEPLAGEIVVQVAAVGLNFRDIMAATNLLPDDIEGEDAWWRNLGLEFSGVVSAVGEGVSTLKIGDRVMGMGRGLLRRYARVDARAVAKIPPQLSFADAAAIPTTFMTAYYSLEYLGRLAKGEKVLIHLGSGGVGLAAIQVARALGAEIFTTAGSEAKRDYLRGRGIQQVMNSRTLNFAADVLAATGGRGVDVVLNSVSGAAIDKSLECLAPFGRFIEIGKRDLAQDKPIGLKSLYYNNSYSVVDLAAVASERPQLLRNLFDTVTQRFLEGIYKPIPTRCFSISNVKDAFRFLAAAQQIGKVVVIFDAPTLEVEFELQKPLRLNSNASYLITGGLRGFGVRVAEWMSSIGAGRLLLVSKSGVADAGVSERLEEIRERGTEVEEIALDLVNCDAVETFVAQQVNAVMPLRGVVHGAAVIEDGFLQQLDHLKIRRVLQPKIAGTWNLHRALERAGAAVDFFVSFSSIAQMIGSPGQGNYVAANSFLDAFSQFRRDRGRTALAVGWGPIGGSGFVARSEALSAYMESSGFKLVSDADAAEMLGQFLRTNLTSIVYAAVDWKVASRALISIASNRRFQPLLNWQTGGANRLLSELLMNPRLAWPDIIEEAVCSEVAKILKVDPAQIESKQKLSETGLDSLAAFQLKNRVESLLDITIPIAKFVQSPSVAGLSQLIAATIDAKIEVDRKATSKGDAADDRGKGTTVALEQLPRQIEAIAIARRAMSSQGLRDGLELAGEILLNGADALERARSAIEVLAEHHPILRLHVSSDESGEQKWWKGKLELTVLQKDDDDFDRPQEALWAFALAPFEDECRLLARTHRAGADAFSLAWILCEVGEVVSGKPLLPSSLTFERFAVERGLSESTEIMRHQAFWDEIVDRMPRAASIPGRRRVLTSAELGIDRAGLARKERRFDATPWRSTALTDLEPALIHGFAKSLSSTFDLGAVVIERHDPARRDSGPPDIVGPVSDSVPVLVEDVRRSSYERVRSTLALALMHRCFDTAAIETAFRPQLLQNGIVLRQFGFAYFDEGLSGRLTGIDPESLAADMPPYNEIRFDLIETKSEIVARLSFDIDTLNDDQAEHLLDKIVTSLPETLKLGLLPSTVDGGRDVSINRAVLTVPNRNRERSIHTSPKLIPVHLNMRQEFLLKTLTSPAATARYRDYWTNVSAFISRPSIDAERLKIALQTVLRRHESLRTRFEPTGSGFNAFVETNCEPEFTVEEVDAGDEAAVRRRLAELDKISIDPFRQAPYALTVVRCPGFGDAIHARAHHVALDGWSIAVMINELFQAYIGLALPEIEISVNDFIRDFDQFGDAAVMNARESYFKQVFRDAAPAPIFDRSRRGGQPNLSGVEAHRSSTIVKLLSREQYDVLREHARRARSSVGVLLMAAMGQTLAKRGRVNEVNILVPLALREHRRLVNFIGWVASRTVVRCRAGTFPTVDGLAQDLADQIRNAIPHMPADFTLQHGRLHDELSARGSYLGLYESGDIIPGLGPTSDWSPAQALQRKHNEEILDFGSFKLEVNASPARETIREFDLRTIEKGDGLVIRCGYDQDVFTAITAADIVAEILDRVGCVYGEDKSEVLGSI